MKILLISSTKSKWNICIIRMEAWMRWWSWAKKWWQGFSRLFLICLITIYFVIKCDSKKTLTILCDIIRFENENLICPIRQIHCQNGKLYWSRYEMYLSALRNVLRSKVKDSNMYGVVSFFLFHENRVGNISQSAVIWTPSNGKAVANKRTSILSCAEADPELE